MRMTPTSRASFASGARRTARLEGVAVPEPWATVRLGEVARIAMGQAPPGDTVSEAGNGLPFLQGNAEFGDVHPSAQLVCRRPARRCEPGDLLVSVRAPVGALNVADRAYAIGRGLASVRFGRLDTAYGRHALHREVSQLTKVAQGSTFEAVGRRELADIRIYAPATEREQRRIAEILDALDDQIAANKRLIAKELCLKEGLLRRLSGTYFAGDAMSNLGEINTLITSGSRGWAEFYANNGAFFIRIGNLTREHINLRLDDRVFVRVPEASAGSRTALMPGDVLISITADLGIIGVVPADLGEAYVNQHVALVRVRPGVNSRWVAYMLASARGQRQFQLANDSGAKAGLNLPAVGRIRVPLPPRAVQDTMARLLDEQDSSVAQHRATLAKLLLLKQALMADLLTDPAS